MDAAGVLDTLKKLTKARIVKSDIARALNVDPAALRRKELAGVQLKPDEIKKSKIIFQLLCAKYVQILLNAGLIRRLFKNARI